MSRIGKLYRIHRDGLAAARSAGSRGWRKVKTGSIVKVIEDNHDMFTLMPIIPEERDGSNRMTLTFNGREPTEKLSGNQYLEKL